MSKTYSLDGIILNRRDYGEADRIVTIFTAEYGKRSFLAKGVRKLSSKRLGSLEIGTHIKALAITGKSMDILSQTVIVNSFLHSKQDLPSIIRLYQLLEVIDVLTREDQEQPDVYQTLLSTLQQLNESAQPKKDLLLHAFQTITHQLGFTAGAIAELNLKAKIEAIADKKLRAKDFLTPGKIHL